MILSIPEYPQDSEYTFPQESMVGSWVNPEYVRVPQDSEDTFPQGSIAGGIPG